MATYYFRNTGNTNWSTATNWSLTDGGPSAGVAPISTDDVYFTSNSGNCTIDIAGRQCNSLIFSGVGAGNYTGTFTMTNTLGVNGDLTLSSGMTISGTSYISISAGTCTITSNGKTWPNDFRTSGGGGTVVLVFNGDFTVEGVVYFTSRYTQLNNGTPIGNLYCNGGFDVDSQGGGVNGGTITGTASIYLKGGIWSQTGASLNVFLNNQVIIDGNVVILRGPINSNVNNSYWGVNVSGNLIYQSGNVNKNYISFSLSSPATASVGDRYTTSGKTFVVVQSISSGTTLICAGTGNPPTSSGTLTRSSGTGTISFSSYTNIIGDYEPIIFQINRFDGQGAAAATWYLPNIPINMLNLTIGIDKTITLQSDLNIIEKIRTPYYNLTVPNVLIFNKTTNEKVSVYNGIDLESNFIGGTADLYLNGGSVRGGFKGNTFLNGNIQFVDRLDLGAGGVIKHLSGNITSRNVDVAITGDSSIVGKFISAIPINSVTITSGVNLTLDEFFTGTASKICKVSATSTNNYTILFTDKFEKIAKFVNITRCNLVDPLQLIVLTNSRFNTNRGRNAVIPAGGSCIRYTNQSPNGFGKNKNFSMYNKQTGLPGGLVGDPNFIKQ